MSQRRVPIHIEDQTLATSVVRAAVMVVTDAVVTCLVWLDI